MTVADTQFLETQDDWQAVCEQAKHCPFCLSPLSVISDEHGTYLGHVFPETCLIGYVQLVTPLDILLWNKREYSGS